MTDFNRQDVLTDMSLILGGYPQFTGDQEIDDTQLQLAVRQALNIFSKQIPKRNLFDLTGDGGKYYTTATFPNWEDDFSEILSIDYDVGNRIADDEAPQFLNMDDGDWTFHRVELVAATGTFTNYLFLPNHSPDATVVLAITYTSRHVLEDTGGTGLNTVPDQYREAILFEAVSRMLVRIAVGQEKGSDPPGGAEFPSLRSKSAGTRALAEFYHELYIGEIGGNEEIPAGASRDFDLAPVGGGDYFFHGKKVR